MNINMTLDPVSIQDAINALREYQSWLYAKAAELSKRLAEMGAVNVSLGYARAAYVGGKDIQVTVNQVSDTEYEIVAGGEGILFVEFGAGIRFGDGHPLDSEFGYGPGTWPDKHKSYNSRGELVENWMNDRGWYTPDGIHTYGNPPSMTMYFTGKELRQRLTEVAKEVFKQ